MREVLISTESGSDVPKNLVSKYHIHVVPMHLIIDNVAYEDDLDHVDRVFDSYEKTGIIPSTSCVNTYEYITFFNQLREKHPDSVIYHFAYSSNASGTWQAARMAIDQAGLKDVYLIDTRSVSGGCTAHIVESFHLIREKAAEYANAEAAESAAGSGPEQPAASKAGTAKNSCPLKNRIPLPNPKKLLRSFPFGSIDSIPDDDTDRLPDGAVALMPEDADFAGLADELQTLADHIECQFMPNTLEYLKAGGRVSNAKFLVANILNVKPLIEINREGFLVATKKYRGNMSKIVEKFVPDFMHRFPLKKERIYLMYGKGLPQEVLNRMKEQAKEFGFKSYEYVMTGCVISCHGGKGAIGLAGVTR